jgi:hypothetical protein
VASEAVPCVFLAGPHPQRHITADATEDLELLANAKGFCFARDGCGNFYWIPVSETRQPDSPVYFACHDPWGNEKVADSLQEFLTWPRFSQKKA